MIVVDTSVALKWVVTEDGAGIEPDAALALSLLDRTLIAPDYILAEYGNALWKKVRRHEIGAEQARQSLEILPAIVTLLPAAGYAARAFEIALMLDHPVYDCYFIAAAEAHGCRMVTADRRLAGRCADGIYRPLVVELKDWRPDAAEPSNAG